MRSVFIVQHAHLLSSGEEDVKLIGAYRSRAAAESAVERLAVQPGFSRHSEIVGPESDGEEGFYIDEYELDKDHWTEGFITMVGDVEYEG
jgi:hypothetical protein